MEIRVEYCPRNVLVKNTSVASTARKRRQGKTRWESERFKPGSRMGTRVTVIERNVSRCAECFCYRQLTVGNEATNNAASLSLPHLFSWNYTLVAAFFSPSTTTLFFLFFFFNPPSFTDPRRNNAFLLVFSLSFRLCSALQIDVRYFPSCPSGARHEFF